MQVDILNEATKEKHQHNIAGPVELLMQSLRISSLACPSFFHGKDVVLVDVGDIFLRVNAFDLRAMAENTSTAKLHIKGIDIT